MAKLTNEQIEQLCESMKLMDTIDLLGMLRSVSGLVTTRLEEDKSEQKLRKNKISCLLDVVQGFYASYQFYFHAIAGGGDMVDPNSLPDGAKDETQ